MTITEFFKILRSKWETVLIVTILAATFGLYVNFFLPHYYRASSEYLIIQKQNAGIDAYTAIKGAEQLAYTYKQVIHSSSFLAQVTESDFEIEPNYFGSTQVKVIKKWRKTAVLETVPNTGILKVDIYHPDQKQALNISQAISSVIKNKQNLFLGDNAEIETIPLSSSIVSNKFVKPRAIINTLLGLIIGFIGSIGFVTMFSQKSSKKINTKLPSKEVITQPIKKNYSLEASKKSSAPGNLPIA
jgi:capsular polysaccharide biosynthesis protein